VNAAGARKRVKRLSKRSEGLTNDAEALLADRGAVTLMV
jgi:hypothetical protein